jgi:tRNA-splicing endonuclease subunit Sen15
MGAPTTSPATTSTEEKPSASALQVFLTAHVPPLDTPYPTALHYLTLQIAHNLRYQHEWQDIRLHTWTSSSASSSAESPQYPTPLLRPLLSGLPSRRAYTHPDEQIEILQAHKRQQQKSSTNPDSTTVPPEPVPQREWVLPSHLREKWTLRNFGTAFDGLSTSPDASEGEALFPDIDTNTNNDENEDDDGDDDADELTTSDDATKLSKISLNDDDEAEMRNNREEMEEIAQRWRSQAPKRLLLATVHEDSTVVYYIVHDGIVKPRQN